MYLHRSRSRIRVSLPTPRSSSLSIPVGTPSVVPPRRKTFDVVVRRSPSTRWNETYSKGRPADLSYRRSSPTVWVSPLSPKRHGDRPSSQEEPYKKREEQGVWESRRTPERKGELLRRRTVDGLGGNGVDGETCYPHDGPTDWGPRFGPS